MAFKQPRNEGEGTIDSVSCQTGSRTETILKLVDLVPRAGELAEPRDCLLDAEGTVDHVIARADVDRVGLLLLLAHDFKKERKKERKKMRLPSTSQRKRGEGEGYQR